MYEKKCRQARIRLPYLPFIAYESELPSIAYDIRFRMKRKKNGKIDAVGFWVTTGMRLRAYVI